MSEEEIAPSNHQTAAVLDKLAWRCIGPHRGGRVVAVAGHPRDRMTFYFGAVAGGVWKTTDGGTYWQCISDGYFQTSSVGALAVSSSDPNVIYVGTGETSIRGNVSHGDGVYKSTDGGQTWKNVGLQDTRHIATVRVHPHDPDLVYVAALGHAFGPNNERGIFRSSDGGEIWEKILFRSERAGGIDLSLDPNNPRILYAALWEAQRYPWTLNSGGPGSGLFKSTDGGDSWTELTRAFGLPEGVIGKIGVAVSPARPERVWALIEAKDGALFRSDNGGQTWENVCKDPKLRRRAWYYTHLFADPQDAETCWILNLGCWKSVDGGKTFGGVPTGHGDNHDLWIDPTDPQRMIEGNDGGAQVSFNGGVAWSTLYNQPTAQFYHVTTDTRMPYRVYGSQQDNSALSLPSRSFNGAIGETEWFVPSGGESGYIAVRPDNPNIVFGGAIGSGFGNGLLWRYDHATQSERNITVWPEVVGMGEGADALKYRFQWTYPVELSPHDPNILYVAGNHLFRSTDEGHSWEIISPDLTRNDKTKQVSSGGPLTKDNTGAEAYDTIWAFRESPQQPGLFWAGTDDGLVHFSRDGGQNWENITPADLPEWALISVIEPSPHDAGTVYMAATRYRLDDNRPYLYKTNDYGQNWQRITAGIPDYDFTRVIRVDPERAGLLYAGTETGVYVSFDDGAQWQRAQGTLPVTPIYDLVRKDGDLVAATHGRSFWILDDVALFRQLADESTVGGEPRLFQPQPVVRIPLFSWEEAPEPGYVNYGYAGPLNTAVISKKEADGTTTTTQLDAGQNPPAGAFIRYYLPEKPEGDLLLTILDTDGNELRTFSSKKEKPASTAEVTGDAGEAVLEPGGEGMEGGGGTEPTAEDEEDESEQPVIPKEAGLNRFVWDLRVAPAAKVPKDTSIEAFFLAGPVVLPGSYQVRLTLGDRSWTQPVEIVPDPRNVSSPEDRQEQFDLLTQINAKLSAANEAVVQLRDLKKQLGVLEERYAGQEPAQAILKSARTLKQALTAVENELIKTEPETGLHYTAVLKLNGRLAALKFAVDLTDSRPTTQATTVYHELAARTDTQLARVRELLDHDLPALNQEIHQAQLPSVSVTPAKK